MNFHADYILASQQGVLERALETSAHNLANISTAGFQGDKSIFAQKLDHGIAYVEDKTTVRDHRSGALISTGDPLHLAINGSGYFMVEGADGTKFYTRSGLFTLNDKRQLTLPSGELVLSAGKTPLTLPDDGGMPTVGPDGTLSGNDGIIGTVGVFSFKDEDGRAFDPTIRDLKTGLLTTDQDPINEEDARLVQYAYEGSNVNPVEEMINQIQISTRYAQNMAILKTRDDVQSDKQDKTLQISTYA